MSLALIVCTVFFQSGSYASHMADFESAKQKGNWATAEASLMRAHAFSQTEYSVHSLAWVYGRQNRVEEALALSHQVVERFGPQPLGLMGLAGACLDAVDLEGADRALDMAEHRGFQQGHGWVSQNIAGLRKTLGEMTQPSVYELGWTIPRSSWDKQGTPRTFMFPLENHRRQTFSFSLEGAATEKRVKGSPENLVEITPKEGQDVKVTAKAVLWPDVITRSVRLGLLRRQINGPPLGALYYHSEKVDPSYGPCVQLAKNLKAPSVWQTMQNILDWRGANITYAQPPAGNTLETILASKRGVCHHSSYLCASLGRALGVDAVVVGGFVLPPSGEFKDVEGSHGWIEFKIPTYGWIEAESQDSRSLGRFMGGRNYLRYRSQNDTAPNTKGWISCQGFKVSGRRVQ